jgi:NADH dehydrogenase/NADH:ubiquinone oxidoreductase subunit G
MANISINGNKISVADGTTVLDAARKNDIYIPTLCDDPRLEPYGGCRLCLVQIKGMHHTGDRRHGSRNFE